MGSEPFCTARNGASRIHPGKTTKMLIETGGRRSVFVTAVVVDLKA